MRVTTAAVRCATTANVDTITESILMSRYAPSTHTWIPERRLNFDVDRMSDPVAPAIDMAVYCNVPGALIAMHVIDSFFFLDNPRAFVTYNGRTTAICAPLPAGCVVQPGRVQVLPITGAHNAVRVTTVGVLCDVTSDVASIRQSIVLLRYWVNTGKWTAERTVVVDSGPAGPAVDMAVYCNVPGALMSVRVVDTFYKTVTSSQMNFPGQTNVLCPP